MVDNYVSGASGFLGQHLLPKLSGTTISIPHNSIQSAKLRDFYYFYFMSAYGNLSWQKDAHMTLKANVNDVVHILNEIDSLDFDPDLFIFLSSSSVNLKVQTCYSRTKLAAEHIILSRQIPSCIVRPFSVTGVGETKEHLIPTLIRSCLEGEEMNFVPHATHDWIDISDVTDALLYFARNKITGIQELGRGWAVSNQEVKEIVEKATNSKANIKEVKSLREYDQEDWYCHEPSYKATKTLEMTVNEMVYEYRDARLLKRQLEDSERCAPEP